MKPAEDLALVAPRLSRRGFVHRVALASTALSGLVPASAAVGGSGGRVRFGLIADIHPDVLPDGLARVQAFVKAMTKPCLLFIHQPFDAENDDAVENAAEVRAVVERAEKQRPGSVLAVFSGHLHLDYARVVNWPAEPSKRRQWGRVYKLYILPS
jgi:hypothetical protein